ncbi:7-deoxyloganetin glucosyltransferase-like [Rhododendron vialii]|uniref:7-deoxyloganetin glucosyltransferase-like n=1 Tax=Rhododendron vialii TaxID=182163 RepID=UPI00265E62F4|nr:7-deoxyloganetin glucosyltransferase-like [Rhododendron vialii]
MGSLTNLEKPHVVCIPYPAQGHINPMLKLAKLLHYKGFHITFVNTEFNHKRLVKSQGLDSLTGVPSFRFEAIPDGLPESDLDATQDIPSLCESCDNNCLVPFKDLVSKLNDTASSNVPPVTCIVSDGALTFTLVVAKELGIPDVVLWTASVCGFMGYVQYHNLIEKGYTPLKDASYLINGYLDTVIEGIPGMEGIRLKDFPSFVRTTDPNDFMIQFALTVIDNVRKASAIIFNTFDELEHDVLEPLSASFPPMYAIGPLHLLVNQIEENSLNVLGSNLWKEDPKCLEWLDSNGPNSVVYVNFGSITVMTPNQLVEFAWGLANSNHAFLWIIRPDLIAGQTSVLPPEFLDVTKDRGLLASWCPQEKVLAHPSIGGFLTHNGWNSTLESISSGVPMVCWPFFSEQLTNCWFSCVKWGIGMEIDSDVKREKVEGLVRELMVGEKGKEMKRRAMEWKKFAEEATQGSSSSSLLNLDKVINQVLLSPRH